MATNLTEYLQQRTNMGFRPVPHYFPSGDFVSYFFRNDRCYAQRVDDLLTIYLAMETHELVGCKIKGVKHILQTDGAFGLTVHDGEIRLGLFFFVGALNASDATQRKHYQELGQVAKDAALDPSELGAV